MRLFRTIARAQQGHVFANMGAAFGLSDELAAQVVRYFVPPIIKSITRRTETTQGLLTFLEFLGSRRLNRYWDARGIFGHPGVEAEGREILVMLFPQAAHVRKIVTNRAKVLPVEAFVLDAMFPYVAILALAAIEQKTREPLAAIFERLNQESRTTPEDNLHKALAGEIQRRRVTSKARDVSPRAGLVSVLGALFARNPDNRTAA